MNRLAFVSLVNDSTQFDARQESLRQVADTMPEWLKVEPNQHGWNAAQGLNHGAVSITEPAVLDGSLQASLRDPDGNLMELKERVG